MNQLTTKRSGCKIDISYVEIIFIDYGHTKLWEETNYGRNEAYRSQNICRITLVDVVIAYGLIVRNIHFLVYIVRHQTLHQWSIDLTQKSSRILGLFGYDIITMIVQYEAIDIRIVSKATLSTIVALQIVNEAML